MPKKTITLDDLTEVLAVNGLLLPGKTAVATARQVWDELQDAGA